MFWLTRPPYLRWGAAIVLVVAALVWDMNGRRGEPYPFAAVPIAAGAVITEADVDWRTMPRGALPMPDLAATVAGRAIAQGEPILPSAIDDEGGIPPGWWSVPVAVPPAASVGTTVLLIDPATGLETEGIVVAHGSNDLFSSSGDGLVAVPAERAAAVAAAAHDRNLIVLVAP